MTPCMVVPSKYTLGGSNVPLAVSLPKNTSAVNVVLSVQSLLKLIRNQFQKALCTHRRCLLQEHPGSNENHMYPSQVVMAAGGGGSGGDDEGVGCDGDGVRVAVAVAC
ncbi:hypothetical protein Tco_1195687 [Tanacetum coccineum]